MNLSGILVQVRPAEVESCIAALEALPGVEVHHSDQASGRIVVVQEAETTGKEVEGLRRIQSLPMVGLAELVYHYFADDPSIHDALPKDLDGAPSLDVNAVPAALRPEMPSGHTNQHIQ